jgi:glycine/D-amino acid oxidase-like deaminating enzyme
VRVLAGRHTIDARHVVIACGYESERFLPRRRCRLISSYALVTEPVASIARWPGRALIWETARPYTYLRTTTDNRILIGGDDLPFRNPVHRDARLPGKSARLLRRAKQKFPGLDLQMAYSWAGTFGETKDGLPFVGSHPGQSERIHYALGVGGNGIVFSFIAADILAAALTQSAHPLAELFSFNRHGS